MGLLQPPKIQIEELYPLPKTKLKALDDILHLRSSIERMEVQFNKVYELLAATQRDMDTLQRENEWLEDKIMEMSECMVELQGDFGLMDSGIAYSALS